MSAIWENETLSPSERLVMLSLADHADDDGACYPSISRISKRTGMTDRGVQKVIARLTDEGFLTVDYNSGRSGSNMYRVRSTPERGSPPNVVHPRTPFTGGVNVVPKTPEPRSPKPSRTINEPSVVIKSIDAVRSELEAWASPQAVTSFMAYRSKSKGKALTITAARRLAGTLKAIFNAGGDCDDALGLAEERGWLTVQEDWYFKTKGAQNGNGNNNGARSGPHNALLAGFAMAAHSLKGVS